MVVRLPVETHGGAPLVDPFGRAITYVRVSVTDRCDFRCVYCMAEEMTFLPRRDLADARRAGPALLGASSGWERARSGSPAGSRWSAAT